MTAEDEPTSRPRSIHRFSRSVTGFPSVWPHGANDIRETGRLVVDGETAETMAGVVRLLRQAAELAWMGADAEGPRSSVQLVALGIDLTAEEIRNLLPDSVDVAGPAPVGNDEIGLLRSAEQLLGTIIGVPAARDAARLQVRVADLVGEANLSAGG
jgi:hypothetical protein